MWLNLAHVCRRWRAVMFASSSRLDLGITVEPQRPGHIKTILSGHLPILINYWLPTHYWRFYELEDITSNALWRMRASLKHRDRVREISFGGWDVIFGEFIRATNHHFPALESLVLSFPCDHEPDIPATFLKGPEQSDLPLRRLRLYGASLASVSGLLLSATALTDLTLKFSSNAAGFDSSQRVSLLGCLQGMQSLRNLNLDTPFNPQDSQSHSTAKDIVPLLKLTHFHYSGSTILLNDLMSGLSAPSLRDACFGFCARFPFLYLWRIIDDVREEFRSVSVTFGTEYFRLLSSTNSGKIDHFKPSFSFNAHCSSSLIINNNSPSTKLATVEELALTFACPNITRWEHAFSWREFLRQFRSVRVLRVNSFVRKVGLYLRQDEGIFPILEEIELSISRLIRDSDEDHQRRAAEDLAAFEPFISARERAGRLVKVYQRDASLVS